jgi:3-hydroxybutyryl-CoA dehydrogenase
MTIKKITIASSGILGAQIAFQTAFHRYSAILFDTRYDVLEELKTAFKRLGAAYKGDLNA